MQLNVVSGMWVSWVDVVGGGWWVVGVGSRSLLNFVCHQNVIVEQLSGRFVEKFCRYYSTITETFEKKIFLGML